MHAPFHKHWEELIPCGAADLHFLRNLVLSQIPFDNLVCVKVVCASCAGVSCEARMKVWWWEKGEVKVRKECMMSCSNNVYINLALVSILACSSTFSHTYSAHIITTLFSLHSCTHTACTHMLKIAICMLDYHHHIHTMNQTPKLQVVCTKKKTPPYLIVIIPAPVNWLMSSRPFMSLND